MCKRLTCLAAILLALVVIAPGVSNGADPTLVGWWTFDDGSGTTPLDSSDYGRHGEFVGGPQWSTGNTGGALITSAGNYVVIPGYTGVLGTNPRTCTAWIKTTTADGVIIGWGLMGNGTKWIMRVNQVGGGGQLRCEVDAGYHYGTTKVNDDQWHHVAVVLEDDGSPDIAEVRLFVDGVLDADNADLADEPINTIEAMDVTIGQNPHSLGTRSFGGLLDEVRVYDRALTQAEIQVVMSEAGPGFPVARSPFPEDGSLYENTWANLSWRAGDFAVSHDVYLGDTFDDVNAGTGDTFRGNLPTTSLFVGFAGLPYPDGLVAGTTYYWRVDEVNDANPDSPWKGDIWSFSVPPRTAYDPDPVDGSKFAVPSATLTWRAGLGAMLHYVYFGDNFDDVNNATAGLPNTTTSYTPAGPLERGKTYYWRVDEFNGSATHKGDVWSFRTIPAMAITDPNLVAWWKLDEGFGTTAADYSGYERHGTLQGDVVWVDGYDGGALQFDGVGDYVTMDGYKGLIGSGARTMSAWVRTTSRAAGEIVGWGPNTATQRMELRIDGGRLRCEHQGGNVQGSTNLTDGVWHHAAVTVSDNATISYPQVKLYLDGADDTIPTTDPDLFATVAGNDVRIGSRPSNNDRFFTGQIDDVRIYDKELTPQELELAMRIDLLPAWRPSPKDGATPDIERATPLTWTRGDKATQHEVYFALDEAAVADADASDTTGIYRGRQSATSYTPAEGLEWGGGPYFWRVDENNNDGTITKGHIWSFTVGDFLVVDDIESYNDVPEGEPGSNRIYLSWIDGFGTTTNGAFVGNLDVPLTERANVHGGGQAMPLSYDNNLKFSEATLTLTAGNDWTRQGVTELSLWHRGVAANAAERMYVALNGTAAVYHNDPNVAQTTAWTEWVIPLQTFAGQGVNLANVTSITLGFGTRGNTTLPGGTGQMYFDDIRLYRPRTTP